MDTVFESRKRQLLDLCETFYRLHMCEISEWGPDRQSIVKFHRVRNDAELELVKWRASGSPGYYNGDIRAVDAIDDGFRIWEVEFKDAGESPAVELRKQRARSKLTPDERAALGVE